MKSSPTDSPRDPAGSAPARSPWRSLPGPLSPRLATLLIAAALAGVLLLGHDRRHAAQMLALALPGLLWLLWPLQPGYGRRAQVVGVWCWSMGFAVDGVVRGYLIDTYQATPDSSMVLASVANTDPQEAFEYLSMSVHALAGWAGALLAAALLVAGLLWHHHPGPSAATGPTVAVRPWRRTAWGATLLAIVLLLSAAGYASKPWRRMHPWIFWSGWSESVQSLRASWTDRAQLRADTLARAQAMQPSLTNTAPKTLVLVLGESINRDNLGLYGYARDTSPQLRRQSESLGREFTVLRHAWSAEPGTLASLQRVFHFGEPAGGKDMHLLAVARAAGYRVWWITNHNDLGIEQIHARFAQELNVLSRTPGRSTRSPDQLVLEPLRAAMDDPAPHKLIVVHLMGAHPHYSLRYPAGQNPFETVDDAVERALIEAGRPFWLRQYRREYDAAVRHHDAILSQVLDLTRTGGVPGGRRAWMYISDHAQEVGHEINHAGHSEATAAGFRIPTFIWQSAPLPLMPADLDERPFRNDWTAWTLLPLLDIRWSGYDASRDVLSTDYRWQPPAIKPPVRSFIDAPPGETAAVTLPLR